MKDALRNFDTFRESLRNFEWLHESVSGAMDVDVLIERKGHLLVIEAKPWRDGVVLPYGQHRCLYSLSQKQDTRVYLLGEDGDIIWLACYNDESRAPVYLRKSRESLWPADRFTPTTREGVAQMAKAWWETRA